MNEIERQIEQAALLHDVGKLVRRALRKKPSHSKLGSAYLQKYGWYKSNDVVIRAIEHHHLTEIQSWTPKPPDDDISYIVYEADNISAAVDRRKNEDGNFGFVADTNLQSVFNVLGDTDTQITVFPLREFLRKDDLQYPQAKEKLQATQELYFKLLKRLTTCFQKKSPAEMSGNELLPILEAVMSYIPSSTAKAETPDISLYDHSKLTAAFALCMYQYFSQKFFTDYHTACFTSAMTYRKKNMFLMLGGSLHGTHSFIYKVPAKGALKNLRGRSFYLELLLEHFVDEILNLCDLSRSCLLYTGGGSFYALLPNTPQTIALLCLAKKNFSDWLLEHYGSELYLSLNWVPCSANEFMADGGGCGQVFQRVRQHLQADELRRYNNEQLEKLFSPRSEGNHQLDGARECAICHRPSRDLQKMAGQEGEICKSCRNLFVFGQKALDAKFFLLSEEKRSDGLAVPALRTKYMYLYAMEAQDMQNNDLPIYRLYAKNDLLSGEKLATNLWFGDYAAHDANGKILDFGELAKRAGGAKNQRSIARLAVLQLNVDDFTSYFLTGFASQDGHYETLSRVASFSRQMSLFFKCYLNTICDGQLDGDLKPFQLFQSNHLETAKNVHIIYASGDEAVIVGAWDDVIGLAVDIWRMFYRFTNGKLTFSAGIGLFHAKAPIAEMMRVTHHLLQKAKSYPQKNRVMLFGESTEVQKDTEQMNHCYTWSDFIAKVCREKIIFLQKHFAFADNFASNKLPLGKSLLYRIMGLLSDTQAINLARFAYVLARMEPKYRASAEKKACYQEVRQQLYQWYKSPEDRKQLLTAIVLLLYRQRDKGEK